LEGSRPPDPLPEMQPDHGHAPLLRPRQHHQRHQAARWIEMSLGWGPGSAIVLNYRLTIIRYFHQSLDAQLSEATQGAASRTFSTLPWLYRIDPKLLPSAPYV